MKLSKNKKLLSLGVVITSIIPLATVVSCGESTKNKRDKAMVELIANQIKNNTKNVIYNTDIIENYDEEWSLLKTKTQIKIISEIANKSNLSISQMEKLEFINPIGIINYGNSLDVQIKVKSGTQTSKTIVVKIQKGILSQKNIPLKTMLSFKNISEQSIKESIPYEVISTTQGVWHFLNDIRVKTMEDQSTQKTHDFSVKNNTNIIFKNVSQMNINSRISDKGHIGILPSLSFKPASIDTPQKRKDASFSIHKAFVKSYNDFKSNSKLTWTKKINKLNIKTLKKELLKLDIWANDSINSLFKTS